MRETAEQFVRGTPEIQSLPDVFRRINEVIERPNSSADEVAKVVMEDPGLSSRLLRLVNSSLFSFPGEIDTISRAIATVGTQQVRDLALATCVIEMFEDVSSEFVNMQSYWEHCIATAVCCRLLAHYREEENTERFFVAGLLHDIGSIVIYLRGGRKLKRIVTRCTRERQNLLTAERATFGFDHADVGRELLKLWGLPGALQEAVGAHHKPSRAKRFPDVANVTHVAEFLVEARDLGSNGEHRVSPVSEEAWLELGLSSDFLPLLYQDLEEQWRASLGAMIR
ncbi:MAG: HDOD domain-containing protein [Myxococcota bacterium]|nr:HDOD domain-containing protein [Myxococcota bacterium]